VAGKKKENGENGNGKRRGLPEARTKRIFNGAPDEISIDGLKRLRGSSSKGGGG